LARLRRSRTDSSNSAVAGGVGLLGVFVIAVFIGLLAGEMFVIAQGMCAHVERAHARIVRQIVRQNLQARLRVNINPRPDAVTVMEQMPAWFADYNEVHPHSALRYRSPNEFRDDKLSPNPCTGS
jgi:transposase InsO family protein